MPFNFSIDTSKLLSNFGRIRSIDLLVDKLGAKNPAAANFEGRFTAPEKPDYPKTANGAPIVGALEFSDGSYTGSDGKDTDYKGLLLEHCLISVSRQKNIVKTILTGSAGTVKEYISAGDFEINIAGFFISENFYLKPEEAVKAFSELCAVPTALNFVQTYLNGLGIGALVIEGFDLPHTEFQNVQKFTLQCLSETPAETLLLQQSAETKELRKLPAGLK